MEEILKESIKSSMGQLDKTTIWVFLTLIVVLISSFQNEKEIELGKIKIPRDKSGLIFYIILCSLNFYILKLLQLLSSSFNLLKNKEETISMMQTHIWVFNPFSKTEGIIGFITDNIGVPFLIIIWWLGLALVNIEIIRNENYKKIRRIIFACFLTYLILGLFSLILIQGMLIGIGGYEIRLITQFIGIILGISIFYFLSNKHKTIQKIFFNDYEQPTQ